MSGDVEALAEVVRRAFWDPESGGQWERIAAALLASDWMESHDAEVRAGALREAAEFLGRCICDRGPTSDGPERECPTCGEEAANYYLGYAVVTLQARAEWGDALNARADREQP